MKTAERRQNYRHETKVEATVFSENLKISATMIEIGTGGLGIISEKPIKPGAEVLVSLNLKTRYSIKGRVVYALHTHEKGRYCYRLGIEADHIIVPGMKAIGFFEQVDFINEILSQIAAQRNA